MNTTPAYDGETGSPLPAARPETDSEIREHAEGADKLHEIAAVMDDDGEKTEDIIRAASISMGIDLIERGFNLTAAKREYWRRQVREALTRADNHFREMQNDHIIDRLNKKRLPSPPPFNMQFDIPVDPDANEFGVTPVMLGLDDDDPRIEEVFGVEYAYQFRECIRNSSLLQPCQPSSASSFPIDAENERSARATATATAAPQQSLHNNQKPARNQRHICRQQHHRDGNPPRPQAERRRSS